MIQRAIKFFVSKQNTDGGWGEACASYNLNASHGEGGSTPSQTAWALMALEACRKPKQNFESEIAQGIQFLNSRKSHDGLLEKEFTGTGFPQHFYLRYDGYRNYFPLIALGRLNQTD
jgi:squalene-hopene/tetraprenyl-beta-curcumene cyclase